MSAESPKRSSKLLTLETRIGLKLVIETRFWFIQADLLLRYELYGENAELLEEPICWDTPSLTASETRLSFA